MDRLLVIVNPAAGGGSCGRRAPAVLARLRDAGVAIDVAETHRAGEATRITREAVANGRRRIVAAGGDGTVFEVVNGLVGDTAPTPTRPGLGVLPLGSGNSFLRDFGDGSIDVAIAALAAGRQRPCDVVRCTHADGVFHFVNLWSIGFVAAVGALRNRRFARLGAFGYVIGVVVETARLRPRTVSIRLDGGELDPTPSTFIAVCNSRFTGGRMEMAPRASTDDGLFDVVHVGPLTRRGLLATFPGIFRGTHGANPAVRTFQGRRLDLELAAPEDVLVDGEILRILPRRLEVVPHAIDVLA